MHPEDIVHEDSADVMCEDSAACEGGFVPSLVTAESIACWGPSENQVLEPFMSCTSMEK